MFGMGLAEVFMILVVALLIFGRRLPEVSRSMGRSFHEFRKGMSDFQEGLDEDLEKEDLGLEVNRDERKRL